MTHSVDRVTITSLLCSLRYDGIVWVTLSDVSMKNDPNSAMLRVELQNIRRRLTILCKTSRNDSVFIPTQWRLSNASIDMVEVMTSPHPMYNNSASIERLRD